MAAHLVYELDPKWQAASCRALYRLCRRGGPDALPNRAGRVFQRWCNAMSEKLLGPARHEPTDVEPYLIWAGTTLLLASVFALALLVLWLYPGATTDRTLHLPLPQYPAPRLQQSPAADMARFYAEEMRWLNSPGYVDKDERDCAYPHQRSDAYHCRGEYPRLVRTACNTLRHTSRKAGTAPINGECS